MTKKVFSIISAIAQVTLGTLETLPCSRNHARDEKKDLIS